MTTLKIPESLLVLAGWGDFPRLIMEGAHAAGVKRTVMLGFKGSALRSARQAADEARMIPFGNFEQTRKAIRESGCRHAVLAGQINPLCLFRSRTDAEFRREIAAIGIRNAHTLFNRFIEIIEELGVEFLPSSLFMRQHIPLAGVLTDRAPTSAETADITYGNEVAMAVCNLDIGQTIVVKDGVVLAVEGFDGTDPTIKRGGRIARRGAIVIKVAKEGHDMRFDIPVIGTKTIAIMKRVGSTALSVQAGRTLLLDQPHVVAAANRAGIAIIAVPSKLPAAPAF